MTMLTPPADGLSRDTLAYLHLVDLERYVPRGEGEPWMGACPNYDTAVTYWCHSCLVGGRDRTCWLCGSEMQSGHPGARTTAFNLGTAW